MIALSIKNLSKIYGNLKAVDAISFEVAKGEVFGFLGPNGAGKTTAMEMMEGLRKPTQGKIEVLGMDISTHLKEVKAKIGVQLQSVTLDERIRVREALKLFSSFYPKSVPLDSLLEQVQLVEKADSFQKNLSGGQKQRLALALCLVNDPELLFLDEPTTGLDPQSRRNLWEIIIALKERGKTIILTTHYLEEAENLCDRVAIIDQGKIISSGSPAELISALGAGRIIEVPLQNGDTSHLKGLPAIQQITVKGGIAEIRTKNVRQTMEGLLGMGKLLNLDEMHIRKATLEDVFIHFTGRQLRE